MDSPTSASQIDLRPPPRGPSPPPRAGWLGVVAILNFVALLGLGVFLVQGGAHETSADEIERQREVASRLLAAGAVDQAADLYGSYLLAADPDPDTRARVAYSLGAAYLDSGRYEDGLRWLYEAEVVGAGNLDEEVGRKVVRALERMGKTHAAEAALASRTKLQDPAPTAAHSSDDPVVARIGEQSFYASELDRALEALPPEASRNLEANGGRQAFLQHFVAQELLFRKARKQEVDRDPEVRQLQESIFKQVVVSRFLESEISSKIQVSRTALESYFLAHRDRYQAEGQEEVTLEQAAPAVERDLRMQETQEAYERLVADELAAAEVELFPEMWADDAS